LRYLVGDTVKANEQLSALFQRVDKELKYYARFDIKKQVDISHEISEVLKVMRDMRTLSNMYNKELFAKISDRFNVYKQTFPDIAKVYNIN
jgi:hypothetical protein